jgi:6-phosphofructokinase
MDGFEHLIEGRTGEVRPLSITDVSRIHAQGGSIIRTSRASPAVRDEAAADPDWRLHACLETLRLLGIGALITIGGDDTAFSASRLAQAAGTSLGVVHVPKTIDNDLPLPGGTPTFGFETARSVGAGLVNNLMTDAMTTQRWYLVVAMGRSAGHLAVGIGKSAGATLTVIAEEFPRDEPVRLSRLFGRPGDLDAQADRRRPSVRGRGARRGSRPAPAPGRSKTASRREGAASRSRVRTSATSSAARPYPVRHRVPT